MPPTETISPSDAAPTPAARPAFRRLPGRMPILRLSLAGGGSRLWLGEEYLVQISTAFWKERTRRFDYGGIHALLLRETPRGVIYSFVFGALAALCGLLAWGMEGPAGRGVLAVLAAVFGLGLIYNAARGGTCSCVLQTALGPQPLPSLNRRRPARKALGLIAARIETVQGELPPGAAE